MPKQFLIKSATIIQQGHSRHLKRSDILISNGIIQQISSRIDADAQLIEGGDLMVSVGWHDMRCHLADPGLEYKEDLSQLAATAAAGGFTSVSTLPNTEPVVDHKSAVQYILNKTASDATDFYPYGAVSDKLAGTNLAEMYDLHTHGAVGFTDGDKSLSSGLLKKALLYVQPFSGLVLSLPLNRSLHHDGQVNESEATVSTGLKTSPAVAEYSQLKQQLDVLEYTGGKLHFSGVSTKESVALIKAAKKKGLAVSSDVAIYNLCFTDATTQGFDSNFKCLPLLRSEQDRQALIKGVNEGVIDAVISNHYAQNVEVKKVEFDYAEVGSISLQTVFSLYRAYLVDQIEEATFVAALTSHPRRVLTIENPEIAEGNTANLVVFDKTAEWTLNQASNKSGSQNTHLWNKVLHGKAVALFKDKHVNLY